VLHKSILDKLVFYSVITSYRTRWGLGKIKKTRTVLVRGRLSQWEKVPDVLGVESVLLVQYFKFSSNIIFAVCNPGLDILFRFGDQFFFGDFEDAVLC